MKEKIDDVRIVNELTNNSQTGINLLFEKYYEDLINYGKYYFSISSEDIEEIASDTIFEVYGKINQYNNNFSFKNWVYIIFKNKLKDFYNKQKKEDEKLKIINFYENDDIDEDFKQNNKGFIEIRKNILSEFTSAGVLEDKRKQIIYDIINEFTPEEQSDLWAYFNGIGHKQSAIYSKISVDAYRKRISRLAIKFFNKIGKKLNKDGKLIYEKFKELN